MKRITTIRRVVTCSVMTLMLLLHVAAAKAQIGFPNPQAIWTADNNTLTFVDWDFWYFEGDTFNGHTVTAVWYGFDYDPDADETESASAPEWNRSTPAWNSTVSETLTTVVFDESFKEYIRPTNCCKWFANCQSLQTITGIENLNTSEVTNMSEMFSGCSALTSLDVSNFKTSNVTDMSSMFQGCTSLTSLNLSKFNTSNVTNMSEMFSDCRALTSLDLSSFDTSNVTNMEGMFFNCNSLTSLDVSSFNTSNVTDMGSMFQECSSLTSLDVTNFVTSNVTNMECMFQDCSSLTSLDLSNFNTSSVVNMHGMFDTCSGLTSLDLSNFDTSNVTEMGNMFLDCSALTTIICNDTWTPTTSTNMFDGCTNLVGGLGTAYNASHINAEYARLDDAFIPGYFTAKSPLVYDAQAIWTEGNTTLTFVHAHHLYRPGDTFNGQTVTKLYITSQVTNSGTSPDWLSTVRSALTKVVFDSSFASVRPRSLRAWFNGCSKLTEIEGISNLNTSEVTDMSSMFSSCSALTSLDVSNFDTSNVTTMTAMFGGCSSLTSLDLSSFDTSKVTDMRYMFRNCSALTSLDLSNFDTSNVTNMSSMFNNCSSLTTIVCNDTWTPTTSTNMFAGCTSLVGGLGTAYDVSHIDAAYARVDDAFTPGYFTPKKPYIPQAIWTAADATLTFVNATTQYAVGNSINGGTVTAVWSGSDVRASGTSVPAWSSTVSPSLTKVVFDRSFASVRPRSLVAWFNGCSNLTAIEGISNLNTSEVTNMRYMFYGCSALTSLDLSNFDTSKVTNMSSMFYECSALTSLDVSSFNTSNVIDMSFMFYYCSSLKSLDLSKFDTRNVTNMHEMFEGCSSLKSLDLSNFNTRKVTAMGYMFYNCNSLTSLDLSNFDTSNKTNLTRMFYGCSSLTTIICDKTWTATNSSEMFRDCPSLVGGAGTAFKVENPVDKTYAHPDGGTANPGYFTSSTEVITAYKPDDQKTYWATYYYSGCNTVALPAEGQTVTIYTAEYSVEEGQRTLILTKVTNGVIKAGQGVIIESNQRDVTVRHTTQEADESFYGSNYLDGCDVETEVADLEDVAEIYTMGAIDTDNDGIRELGFYKFAGSKLKARRAYVTFLDYEFIPIEEEEGGEAGIRIRFADEDTATGIDEVQSTIDKVQSATIYDLQGRRVVNPTKGIYIVNGKKVYMK